MRNIQRHSLAIILVAFLLCRSDSLRAESKPNFTGVWKVNDGIEIDFIDQKGSNIAIRRVIHNSGFRVIHLRSPIDGKEYPQIIDNFPGTFRASWNGNSLVWETRREIPNWGELHDRTVMTLSSDGQKISADYRRTAEPPSNNTLNNAHSSVQIYQRIEAGDRRQEQQKVLESLTWNKAIEKSVQGSSVNVFPVLLEGGQFVDFLIERKKGVGDAIIVGPDDEVAASRVASTRYKKDHIYYVAKKTGLHSLQLYTFGLPTNIGTYSVKLAKLRTATDDDRLRLEAEAHLARAKQLLGPSSDPIPELIKALQGFNHLEDASRQAEAVQLMAKFYSEPSYTTTAELLLQSAIRYERSAQDREGEADCRLELGRAQEHLKNLSAAIQSYLSALDLYRDVGSSDEAISAAGALAAAYSKNGELQKALDTNLERLTMARSLPTANVGSILRMAGLSYLKLGKRDEALDALEEAARDRRIAGDHKSEISDLLAIAFSVFSGKDDEKALSYFQRALDVAERAGIKDSQVSPLVQIGETLARLGRHETAISTFERALTLIRDSKDPWSRRSLVGKGRSLEELGRFVEANECFRAFQGTAEASATNQYKDLVILHIAANYVSSKRVEEAVRFVVREAEKDRATTSAAMEKIGPLLAERGQIQDAIQFFRSALGDLSNLAPSARLIAPKPEYRQVLYNQLESLYIVAFQGRGLELALYDTEFAEAELYGDKHWLTNVLVKRIDRDISSLLMHGLWASDFALAMGLADGPRGRAELLAVVGRDLALSARLDYQTIGKDLLGASGIMALISPQVDLQLSVLRAHIPVAVRDSKVRNQVLFLIDRIPAEVDPECGQVRSKTYSELSTLLISLGESKKSEELLRRLDNDDAGFCSGPAQFGYLRDIDVLDAAGALEDARPLIEEHIRKLIPSKNFNYRYFEGRWVASDERVYSKFSEFLMRDYMKSRSESLLNLAFEMNENGLSNFLTAGIRQSGNERLQGDQRQVVDAGDRNVKTAIIEALQGVPTRPPQNEFSMRDRLNSLPNDLIEKAIKESNIFPGASSNTVLYAPHRPLTAERVQKEVLDDRTALLEYSFHKDQSYLWAITSDAIKGFELPNVADVSAAVNSFNQLVQKRSHRGPALEKDHQDPADLNREAITLGRLLLGPAATLITGRRILIAGDGLAQTIPFAALGDPNEPLDTYVPLMVSHEIANVPSASALAAIRQETLDRLVPSKTLAILADPVFSLQDSRFQSPSVSISQLSPTEVLSVSAEADSLQRATAETGLLEPGQTNLARLPFTGFEANALRILVPPEQEFVATGFEANLVAATSGQLANYKIVHFATHGLLNDRHWDLSGLILSLYNEEGKRQDGFLSSEKINKLNLPVELVVLSACNTARGPDLPGEGLLSLTRGFFSAGAKRVVASLWPVDDSATVRIMERFYNGMLVEKLSPAAALRASQIATWKTNGNQSPYYWAGFVIQGEFR